MKVSVALCTFNGERFIREQLLSIFEQTRKVDELIICDDGSVDGTLTTVRSLLEHESEGNRIPFVITVNEKPLGVTKNFEKAVSLAKGDVIFLSDQDDVWRMDKVERILQEFTQNPELLLVNTDATLIDENGNSLGENLFSRLPISTTEFKEIYSGNIFPQLLKRNTVTGATLAFRRFLLGEALPFPQDIIHDEWLALVAAKTDGVKTLDSEMTKYRQHSANQIGAQRLTLFYKVKKLFSDSNERNARLLLKSKLLIHLLENSNQPISANYLEMATGKFAHEQMRSSLHSKRWKRIVPVAREYRTGSYSMYGLGMQDVLRDLCSRIN